VTDTGGLPAWLWAQHPPARPAGSTSSTEDSLFATSDHKDATFRVDCPRLCVSPSDFTPRATITFATVASPVRHFFVGQADCSAKQR